MSSLTTTKAGFPACIFMKTVQWFRESTIGETGQDVDVADWQESTEADWLRNNLTHRTSFRTYLRHSDPSLEHFAQIAPPLDDVRDVVVEFVHLVFELIDIVLEVLDIVHNIVDIVTDGRNVVLE